MLLRHLSYFLENLSLKRKVLEALKGMIFVFCSRCPTPNPYVCAWNIEFLLLPNIFHFLNIHLFIW